LAKLGDGSLDDEIWGKIVVMERGRRIAKAYLRKITLIVDGGDEEFDGKTLGFNHFRSTITNENRDGDFRSKIGDVTIPYDETINVNFRELSSKWMHKVI
jgi:hypothetical protein